MKEIEGLLRFWFGELHNELANSDKNQLWYQATEQIDQEIKVQFLDLYQQALNNELAHWQQSARGSLALVILLDQMPRNMFRGTAQAFASDKLALEVAQHGVTNGFDKKLQLIEQIFYYHPFEHSENLAIQQQSVKLFSALRSEYQSVEQLAVIDNAIHWAKEHKDIIEQFARFPHRNSILGRESSDAELEYVKTGSDFGQVSK